jgi:hypothetical protein
MAGPGSVSPRSRSSTRRRQATARRAKRPRCRRPRGRPSLPVSDNGQPRERRRPRGQSRSPRAAPGAHGPARSPRRQANRAVHAVARVKAIVPIVGDAAVDYGQASHKLEPCGSSCKRSWKLAFPGGRSAAGSSSAPARHPTTSLPAERSRACRAGTPPWRLRPWSLSERRSSRADRGVLGVDHGRRSRRVTWLRLSNRHGVALGSSC